MKICPNCNRENENDALECASCGEDISSVPTVYEFVISSEKVTDEETVPAKAESEPQNEVVQETSNSATDELSEKIKKLDMLREQGILTEEEYSEQKKKLIDRHLSAGQKKSLNVAVPDTKELLKNKKLLAIIAAVIFAFIGFYCQKNILYGNDKIAYEMVYSASKQFKNPSSVRVESGRLGVDKDCLFVKLSATNGFGARRSEYYVIDDRGIPFSVDEFFDSTTAETIKLLAQDNDKTNWDKVNRALEKAYKSY